MAITNPAAVAEAPGIGRRPGRKAVAAKKRATDRERKERVHITLAPRSLDMLEELARKSESSYTGVFKNALRLYHEVVEATERGDEFYVKDKDGNIVAWKLFL